MPVGLPTSAFLHPCHVCRCAQSNSRVIRPIEQELHELTGACPDPEESDMWTTCTPEIENTFIHRCVLDTQPPEGFNQGIASELEFLYDELNQLSQPPLKAKTSAGSVDLALVSVVLLCLASSTV